MIEEFEVSYLSTPEKDFSFFNLSFLPASSKKSWLRKKEALAEEPARIPGREFPERIIHSTGQKP
jgi:hypothetical protein